ncbi:MAG: hypothetical protein WA958_12720 [Tunicatimonas sp.]
MDQVVDIKAELQELIAQESDVDILQAIRTLLQKTRLDTTWQEKLIRRAQRAEIDIQAGRLYNREQVVAQTNRKIQ